MSRVSAFSGMPGVLLNGYGITIVPRSATIAQDAANDRRRRIGLGTQAVVSVSFLFNTTTYTQWRAFWNTDLAGGTLDMAITLANGYQSGTYTARILGPYTVQDMQGNWKVSVPVEWIDDPASSPSTNYPRLDTSGDDYAKLTDGSVDPQTFDDLADTFHYLVHRTIPWGIT